VDYRLHPDSADQASASARYGVGDSLPAAGARERACHPVMPGRADSSQGRDRPAVGVQLSPPRGVISCSTINAGAPSGIAALTSRKQGALRRRRTSIQARPATSRLTAYSERSAIARCTRIGGPPRGSAALATDKRPRVLLHSRAASSSRPLTGSCRAHGVSADSVRRVADDVAADAVRRVVRCLSSHVVARGTTAPTERTCIADGVSGVLGERS
jgi:hypothetical protein